MLYLLDTLKERRVNLNELINKPDPLLFTRSSYPSKKHFNHKIEIIAGKKLISRGFG